MNGKTQFSDRDINTERSLDLTKKFPDLLEPKKKQGIKIENFLLIREEDGEQSKSLDKKSVSLQSPSRKKKYYVASKKKTEQFASKELSPSRMV